jgi:FAD/FMN-containing dehydrogenase
VGLVVQPCLIARCSSTAEIVAVVKSCFAHGVAVTVRGGGHNVAGFAVHDGAVLIDLVSRAVRVNLEAK